MIGTLFYSPTAPSIFFDFGGSLPCARRRATIIINQQATLFQKMDGLRL
jgi:hypothetical protein